MINDKNNNLSEDTLSERLLALEKRLDLLREEVDVLRDKKRKVAKKEFTATMKLEEVKMDFLKSRPHDRKDPFNNWELVFWASYVISNTPRREKLDTIAEVAKRGHKVQTLVDFYVASYKNKYPNESGENIDKAARLRVKDYLEYVLLSYPELQTKNGPVPMTFYIAVSNWAINTYGAKVGSWQQTNQIEDRPPEK